MADEKDKPKRYVKTCMRCFTIVKCLARSKRVCPVCGGQLVKGKQDA